jgi:hypothetical protein
VPKGSGLVFYMEDEASESDTERYIEIIRWTILSTCPMQKEEQITQKTLIEMKKINSKRFMCITSHLITLQINVWYASNVTRR